MKKISLEEAYGNMNEIDLKVLNQELEAISQSDQRGNKEMSQAFFLDKDGSIVVEVYWDRRVVEAFRFTNQGTSTEKETDLLDLKELFTKGSFSYDGKELTIEQVNHLQEAVKQILKDK